VSWRTNRGIVLARSLGRTLGLNKWIASFLMRDGYEAGYDRLLLAELAPGDCVWDIGANIGYYSKLFSQCVGKEGTVLAFEPSPLNFARLSAACRDLKNVSLVQLGLGREDAKVSFRQGVDSLGATSRIVDHGPGEFVVDIRSGASLIDRGAALAPNAIKIDVEGFECEVLEGLGNHIAAASLRTIGVEVHFGLLKERGLAEAPREIEALLHRSGFIVKWIDSSHILATRARQ